MSLKSMITQKIQTQLGKKVERLDEAVTDAENQIVMDPDKANYTALPAGADLDKIKQECEDMVKKRALAAAAVSAMPMPILSATVDAALLTELLPEISAKFGLTPYPEPIYDKSTKKINWPEVKDYGVDFVSLVAKRGLLKRSVNGLGGNFLVRTLSRYVPVVGTISAASISYYIFKKIANDYIDKCYTNAKRLEREGKNSSNNPGPVIAQKALESAVKEVAKKSS